MPSILSDASIKLISSLREESKSVAEGIEGEYIHVSNITRGLGFLYERIRNTLDYQEESLWAKNAILRILNRKKIQFLSGQEIGLSLIQELIRGRYLENDCVPLDKASQVDLVLLKYRMLWNAVFQEKSIYSGYKESIFNWILELAACEIEEMLRKNQKDFFYFKFLYESIRERIEFYPKVSPEISDIQIYLSSFRSLFQADNSMEYWMLWRLYFPEWSNSVCSEDYILELSKNIVNIKRNFDEKISWPLRNKLDKIVKRFSVLTMFLRDILDENLAEAEKILTDSRMLEEKLLEVYQRRYNENRARLKRIAFRAILFIFFTKLIFALAIEAPYEVLVLGKVDSYALALNTIIPPIILMIASLSIRMPGEEANFTKLMAEFNKFLGKDSKNISVLRMDKNKSDVVKILIGILYLANFALVFWVLSVIVRALKFNILSAAIFVFFLSVVSLFAIKIRKTANELIAVEEYEHWVRQIFDFMIFPFLEIGRAVSWGFRSLNLVAFLFDFLLEAPFNAFIEIMEEWFSFLRERRESL
jgi:hypothetical protein